MAEAGGSGNTQVSISDTIPAGTPSAGDLWWESDTGRLKIYYQDVDSAQWVDVNAILRQDRIASTGAPSSLLLILVLQETLDMILIMFTSLLEPILGREQD